MIKISRIVLLLLITGAAFNLKAAIFTYDATEALSQAPYHNGSHNHALWMPGLAGNNDWLFDGGPGTFTYNDATGAASLSGDLFNEGNPTLTGNFLFTFGENPNGVPKKELTAGSYSENGGPVDTDTWKYFDTFSGSFTGSGDLAGLELSFDQRPVFDPSNPNTVRGQLGIGANGKNIDYGFSSWFFWSVTGCDDGLGNNGCQTLGLMLGENGDGDINISLAAVPLPAAVWLFGSAMLGLIGLRRRQASIAR